MISHARFGALRLAQLLPDAEIAEPENWEFMYHVWLGEAVGFSEWLRLENDPGVLRSLAIDFTDFPGLAAAEVLRTIELPVQRGMKLGELREILGEPVNELRLPKVKDRVTYEFFPSGTARYDVRCTVRNEGGLERINFRFAHIRKANHSSPLTKGRRGVKPYRRRSSQTHALPRFHELSRSITSLPDLKTPYPSFVRGSSRRCAPLPRTPWVNAL